MSPSAQIDGYILTYQFPDGTVKVLLAFSLGTLVQPLSESTAPGPLA